MSETKGPLFPKGPSLGATLTGLEPATSAVTGRHANQLRYRAMLIQLCGDPNGIRTRATAVKGRRPRPLNDGAERTVRLTLTDAQAYAESDQIGNRRHGLWRSASAGAMMGTVCPSARPPRPTVAARSSPDVTPVVIVTSVADVTEE